MHCQDLLTLKKKPKAKDDDQTTTRATKALNILIIASALDSAGMPQWTRFLACIATWMASHHHLHLQPVPYHRISALPASLRTGDEGTRIARGSIMQNVYPETNKVAFQNYVSSPPGQTPAALVALHITLSPVLRTTKLFLP